MCAQRFVKTKAPLQRGGFPVLVLAEVQPQLREVLGHKSANQLLTTTDLLIKRAGLDLQISGQATCRERLRALGVQ